MVEDGRTLSDRWLTLPQEDLAIRSLLLRAYDGADPRPEITVVQKSNGAKARYQLVFPDCTYLKDGREGFLDESE
jgi:hypothetical protein